MNWKLFLFNIQFFELTQTKINNIFRNQRNNKTVGEMTLIQQIGGGLTQYVIEKPLTIPFENALLCCQLNDQTFYSNLCLL